LAGGGQDSFKDLAAQQQIFYRIMAFLPIMSNRSPRAKGIGLFPHFYLLRKNVSLAWHTYLQPIPESVTWINFSAPGLPCRRPGGKKLSRWLKVLSCNPPPPLVGGDWGAGGLEKTFSNQDKLFAALDKYL
jgi:hypothetical protein